MINKFKALDNIGLISYLRKLVLAIRLFFATKSEMDVVATALTDLDRRIDESIPTIEVGDVTTGTPGTPVQITNSGTETDVVLNFSIPRGEDGKNGKDGTNGKDGISPIITVGTVTTVASTESASVVNSGTSHAVVLDFNIPQGPLGINGINGINGKDGKDGTNGKDGVNGKDGMSATVRVGSVVTVTSNESATVTNSGTKLAAILDFRIPKGADGANGKNADEDVIAIALTDLDNRKIEASDIPTSLPANGGNADTSDYAAYLRGRDGNGVYFGKEASSNIIAEWNTKSDNRWYLKAASTNQCRVEYADKASEANKISWSNIENKPVDTVGDASLVIQVNGTKIIPTGGDFTANKSGDVSIYNIPVPTTDSIKNSVITSTDFASAVSLYIGNGRLILKNGNDIISDTFTANKGDDTTINLNFTNKSDFESLGSKVDKIDTSIAELNTKTQVTISSDDSSEGGEEETVEAIDNPFSKQMGTITLRFWNSERYENLPVYDVWVNYVTDVVGPFGYVNYCYEIFLVIDIYDYLNSIVSSVGFTSGIYKPFFIRGANLNNNVCDFDVRGSGNINTAIATVIGRYMHLKCYLLLHGGDSGMGNDIMQKAANEQFSAYLCLRQTP